MYQNIICTHHFFYWVEKSLGIIITRHKILSQYIKNLIQTKLLNRDKTKIIIKMKKNKPEKDAKN